MRALRVVAMRALRMKAMMDFKDNEADGTDHEE